GITAGHPSGGSRSPAECRRSGGPASLIHYLQLSDQSGVIWTEKPHPLLEAAMNKVSGKPLEDGPSSPPYGAVDLSTRSPTHSASVNPRSIIGSATPEASGSIAWTGAIAPASHGRPLGPMQPSRIWS